MTAEPGQELGFSKEDTELPRENKQTPKFLFQTVKEPTAQEIEDKIQINSLGDNEENWTPSSCAFTAENKIFVCNELLCSLINWAAQAPAEFY